jgi:hypothetical protein
MRKTDRRGTKKDDGRRKRCRKMMVMIMKTITNKTTTKTIMRTMAMGERGGWER